ncbi:D-alanyl-D-alanine carboxypeptidase [Microbacterium sp. Root166]|uniref:D-alanyl-D-alanine carboxypeptidase family protein n=1 Tax=Microbacterium sp. Root166 TaxID=1736478 RepID=UPI0006FAABAC|nr:D-alanyl-D-alanine carboxypeptidase [Microbacterium sp. Root166]KQZ85425.1 D-alanyl-D-alanine carboxypeptidase [Microbacterium sp. Root166]
MTLDDPPAPTRRARRAQTGASEVVGESATTRESVLTLEPETAAPSSSTGSLTSAPTPAGPSPSTTPLGQFAGPRATGKAAASGHVALAWVDERTLSRPGAPADLAAASTAYIPVGTDLLADPPRRSPLRAGVVVPTLVIAGLVGAYAGTTLLWPLHEVAPTVSAVQVQPVAAPAAALPWPAVGSAAVVVDGVGPAVASAADPASIASITKIVTALVVLDAMPLAAGEQGPDYRFTRSDSTAYWNYLRNGESALDVPVGGSLTQYQMLEGMLIGSANNYADRLASTLYPSDEVFARAAMTWLTAHGVSGVTIVEPSGIDPDNTATPEALLTLAEKALEHPVLAEIVAKPVVELPGAGTVKNGNGLLADPGVLGLKTGTLDSSNLLSAKQITVGDVPIRLYASVLGQPDNEARLAASRALYSYLEQDLQVEPSVTAGTLAGTVETPWGESVNVVAAGDASVVLWNGGSGGVTSTFDLGDARTDGAKVGELEVDGPLNDATVDLLLADEIEGPSIWWRLTHPLHLFGLAD